MPIKFGGAGLSRFGDIRKANFVTEAAAKAELDDGRSGNAPLGRGRTKLIRAAVSVSETVV